MAELPRLNKVIEALASGKPAFTSFCQADPETAIAMTTAKYDGIVFEMEHNPWDIRALRDSLQYMLNRGQFARAGSVAPAVTPMVRHQHAYRGNRQKRHRLGQLYVTVDSLLAQDANIGSHSAYTPTDAVEEPEAFDWLFSEDVQRCRATRILGTSRWTNAIPAATCRS